MTTLGERTAALLEDRLASEVRLHGGDLSEVARVRLGSGRTVVAKASGLARQEAAMLREVRSTGAPAPEVFAEADGLVVMEDLGADDGTAGAREDLGRVVRRLHSRSGASYGWGADHAFGSAPILNAPTPTWPAFWAERRLLAWVERLPAELARRVERAAARLGDLLPERPAPVLLHGDLWSGNVMVRGERVIGLIDPACHFGDREVDLAMLTLFGAPGPAFWKAYGPTEPGLESRRPVYQLWPALVHLRLFGSGYRGLVERLLAQIGY